MYDVCHENVTVLYFRGGCGVGVVGVDGIPNNVKRCKGQAFVQSTDSLNIYIYIYIYIYTKNIDKLQFGTFDAKRHHTIPNANI